MSSAPPFRRIRKSFAGAENAALFSEESVTVSPGDADGGSTLTGTIACPGAGAGVDVITISSEMATSAPSRPPSVIARDTGAPEAPHDSTAEPEITNVLSIPKVHAPPSFTLTDASGTRETWEYTASAGVEPSQAVSDTWEISRSVSTSVLDRTVTFTSYLSDAEPGMKVKAMNLRAPTVSEPASGGAPPSRSNHPTA